MTFHTTRAATGGIEPENRDSDGPAGRSRPERVKATPLTEESKRGPADACHSENRGSVVVPPDVRAADDGRAKHEELYLSSPNVPGDPRSKLSCAANVVSVGRTIILEWNRDRSSTGQASRESLPFSSVAFYPGAAGRFDRYSCFRNGWTTSVSRPAERTSRLQRPRGVLAKVLVAI